MPVLGSCNYPEGASNIVNKLSLLLDNAPGSFIVNKSSNYLRIADELALFAFNTTSHSLIR
nr:MAG TPA: hypothetical protein [Caudoviricetes sp.]